MEEDLDEQTHKERESKENRYDYQVNRNKFIGIMLDDLIHALTAKTQVTLLMRMKKIMKRAQLSSAPSSRIEQYLWQTTRERQNSITNLSQIAEIMRPYG